MATSPRSSVISPAATSLSASAPNSQSSERKRQTETMESGTISQASGEEVTGCPVMHQDFSTTRNLGDYWALANDLRESCPHFYNKYSGGGYWVFTRHEAVKDIYKTPE